MTGNPDVLKALNALLADELTAINQYMVHSEMCDNWGYEVLHKAIEKRAVDEMHHAETLIARILFLEGSPTVSKLNTISIGKTVEGDDCQRPRGGIGRHRGVQRGDPPRGRRGGQRHARASREDR